MPHGKDHQKAIRVKGYNSDFTDLSLEPTCQNDLFSTGSMSFLTRRKAANLKFANLIKTSFFVFVFFIV